MRTLLASSVSALVLAVSVSAVGEAQTRVSRADANAAIAAMGLDQSRSDEISFDSGRFSRGDYVFTNVVFHIDDDEDEPTKAGEDDFNVDFDGGELLVAEMRFSAPRLASDGRVMFDAFSLSGVSAEGDDGEGLSLDSLEIVGPDADFAAMIAEAFANPGDSDEDDFELGEDPFERIAMSGFQVIDSEDGPTTVSLGSMILEHDDAESLARFEMTDFLIETDEGDDGPVRIALGEVRVEGLSTDTTDEWFSAIENDNMSGFMQSYMNAATVNPASLFSEFVLSDFDFQAAGLDLSLASVTAENEMRRGEVHSSVALDRLHFSADSDHENGAQIAAALMMLGYSELNLHAVGNTIYEPERGRAYTSGDNYYVVEDAFRIDFSQDIEGYNEYSTLMADLVADAAENGEDASEEAAMAAMAALQVNEFSVRITDQSILDRAFGAMATQQGIAPEQARAQASALVLLGAASAGPMVPAPLMSELTSAVSSFLNNGGSVTVGMRPTSPTSVGDMMMIVEQDEPDIDRLGISVSAEPAQ